MAKQFTLGKNEKLKSRKSIEQLFSEGKKYVVSPFRVFYLMDDKTLSVRSPLGNIKHSIFNTQFGVGVSNKNFRKAVDRNRIKRLTREAWRLQKLSLQEKLKRKNTCLNVFFIYTAKELPEYRDVFEKVGTALKKLEKIVDEAK